MSAHPYIPNSAPGARAQMLEALGIADSAELYASIPERLRLSRSLEVPGPLDEYALERELTSTLARNSSCDELLSFLGAGCWHHYVPAICDEVVRRAEFLTAYWADAYTDYGKHQAFFEYASLLGELVDLDAVSLPTYDYGTAAAVSLRMAARITQRERVVIAGRLSPERQAIIDNYLEPDLTVTRVPAEAGVVAGVAVADAVGSETAAVYFENPAYLGTIESRGELLCELAHQVGALAVVGVDPSSLGVLAPPPAYGADIVCGELQPLGMHMDLGGGLAGFIATPDREEYIAEYPTFLIGITPTDIPGEHGFGLVAWDRTSYVRREHGKDFGGTTTALHAIAAAVYLAALGPTGLHELGNGIIQRATYAARRIGGVPGVRAPVLEGSFFKEFVANIDATGLTVSELNHSLLRKGILGGKDLSAELPTLGQATLISITERHTKADIDHFVAAVEEVTR